MKFVLVFETCGVLETTPGDADGIDPYLQWAPRQPRGRGDIPDMDHAPLNRVSASCGLRDGAELVFNPTHDWNHFLSPSHTSLLPQHPRWHVEERRDEDSLHLWYFDNPTDVLAALQDALLAIPSAMWAFHHHCRGEWRRRTLRRFADQTVPWPIVITSYDATDRFARSRPHNAANMCLWFRLSVPMYDINRNDLELLCSTAVPTWWNTTEGDLARHPSWTALAGSNHIVSPDVSRRGRVVTTPPWMLDDIGTSDPPKQSSRARKQLTAPAPPEPAKPKGPPTVYSKALLQQHNDPQKT